MRRTWFMLRAQWRLGSVKAMVACLCLAMVAQVAVLSLSARIREQMAQDGQQWLGADAVLVWDRSIGQDVIAQAQAAGLRTALIQVFPSMVFVADDEAERSTLVAVKAVSAEYPLRGDLRVKPWQVGSAPSQCSGLQDGVALQCRGPKAGQLWVDQALLDQLGLKGVKRDSGLPPPRLQLGQREFDVAGVIDQEPDRGMAFANLAPRVMMATEDLALSGLLQAGSRVTYRLAVSGQPKAVQGVVQTWQKAIQPGQRIDQVQNGRQDLQRTIDIAQRFLALVAMVTSVVAGFAVGLAFYEDGRRRMTELALLKALGLTPHQALAMTLQQLLVGLLLATVLSVVIGVVLAHGLAAVLSALDPSMLGNSVRGFEQWSAIGDVLSGISQDLAKPSLWLITAWMGLTVWLAAALVPVMRAVRVPAWVALRGNSGANKPLVQELWRDRLITGLLWVLAFVSMSLITMYARPERLGWESLGPLGQGLQTILSGGGSPADAADRGGWLATLGQDIATLLLPLGVGLLVVLLGFAGITAGVMWMLRSLVRHEQQRLRAVLLLLQRRWLPTVAEGAVMALAFTLLAVVVFIQQDLLTGWQQSLRDRPNRFAINIQPDQYDAARVALAGLVGAGKPAPELYPSFRARLIAINDQPLRGAVEPRAEDKRPGSERAQRLIEREFNAGAVAELPAHNQLLAGRWFASRQADDKAMTELSVEAGLSKTLGLKLNDVLSFDIAGEPLQAKVTSIRSLRWDSMQVNFYLIFSPHGLERFAQSAITAFYVPDTAIDQLSSLTKQFPNVTVVDLRSLIKQGETILARLVQVLLMLTLLTVAAAFAVMFLMVAQTLPERWVEQRLLYALGMTPPQLRRLMLIERLLSGLIAGLVATGVATALGQYLAKSYFEFYLPFNYLPWLLVPLMSMLLSVAGLFGSSSAQAAGIRMKRVSE